MLLEKTSQTSLGDPVSEPLGKALGLWLDKFFRDLEAWAKRQPDSSFPNEPFRSEPHAMLFLILFPTPLEWYERRAEPVGDTRRYGCNGTAVETATSAPQYRHFNASG